MTVSNCPTTLRNATAVPQKIAIVRIGSVVEIWLMCGASRLLEGIPRLTMPSRGCARGEPGWCGGATCAALIYAFWGGDLNFIILGQVAFLLHFLRRPRHPRRPRRPSLKVEERALREVRGTEFAWQRRSVRRPKPVEP